MIWVDIYDGTGYICDFKWIIRWKSEKDHQDCPNLGCNVKCWSFICMVVMFTQSSYYIVCFALWLQVLTFMELEGLWVFDLFVLLVYSQVYHLCCLLFVVNLAQCILWWREIGEAWIIKSENLIELSALVVLKKGWMFCSDSMFLGSS